METYFDPETGKLVVGAEAIEAEAAGTLMGDYDFEQPPTDTSRPGQRWLPELLTIDDFPYEKGTFRNGYLKDWTVEQLTAAGSWIMNLVGCESGQTLREEHIRRLNSLGLVPSIDTFQEKVGPLWKIRQEATGKIAGGTPSSVFREWSRDQWAEYATRVEKLAGGKRPSKNDYNTAAKELGGPTVRNIVRAIGGLSQLNELLGYANRHEWDQESIVAWGADVMQANPRVNLSARVAKILSKRKVGPSDWEIRKQFEGGHPEFQRLAAEELERRQQELAERQRELASRFDGIIANKPPTVDIQPYDNEAQKAAFVARFDLAKQYIAKNYDAYLISSWGSGNFLQNLLKNNPDIKIGQIELETELEGTMDIIWPPPENPKLKLTEKDLGYKVPAGHGLRKGGGSGASIQEVQASLAAASEQVQAAQEQAQQALIGLEQYEAELQLCLSDSMQPEAEEALRMSAQAREQTDQLLQTIAAGIDSVKRVGDRL